MVNVERFVYPQSLEEALEALAPGREAARALAGGTSLIFFHGQGTRALVDITRLGLDELTAEGGDLSLGACVRLQRLADSPLLFEPGLRALSDAAAVAGSRAVRNAVTLGGNVVGYKRWSDTPNALLALGALAEVAGAGAPPRTLPLADLFAKHPQTVLDAGELLTRIRLPRPPAGAGSAYVKFGHTKIDYALASAAARLTLDGAGRVTEATLVVGAVEHLPASQPWIGEVLLGERPEGDALSRVAARLREGLRPAADMRATEGYLRELAAVVATDALYRAAERARGEDRDA